MIPFFGNKKDKNGSNDNMSYDSANTKAEGASDANSVHAQSDSAKDSAKKSADDKKTSKKSESSVDASVQSVAQEARELNKSIGRSNTVGSVILGPHMTEKAHDISQNGRYVFRVRKNASKTQIARAIESMHNVSVVRVQTVNMPKKRRTVRYNRGYQQAYKKAIVTLKEGDKISLFETA